MVSRVPSDWSITNLGACSDWYSGGTPDTDVSAYWGGEIPWITASSLHEFYITDSERRVTPLGLQNGTRLMPRNTIIFVVRGMSLKSVFRVGIARRPVAFGQDCKPVIAHDEIEPLFLANVLRAKAPDVLGIVDEASHGTGRLQTDALKQLEVPLPCLAEQRAIARILGALDDKIELNRRMNATLEAMARALFKSWFVDFDPVHTKLALSGAEGAEGRDTGLPAEIAGLFPDGFEESAVGEAPAGWHLGMLNDFASLNPESWSRATRPALIRYVDLTNTKWGRIEAITEYAQQDAPSRAQRVLRPGDTIIGTVRPGNGSFAYVSEDGLTGSTGFAVLRPRKAQYQEFVYLAATTGDSIGMLAHLADGGAYPAVRPEIVASTQVVCPTDAILLVFARIRTSVQSRTLAALRDALLPKLISGAVRVGDVERFVGAAA